VHPLPLLFFPPFVENGTVVREALRRARAREREREGPGGVSSLTRGWNRCRLLSSDYFAWHNEWVVFLTLFPLPLHLPLSYLSFPLFLSSSASGPLRVRLIKLGIQRWLPSPPPSLRVFIPRYVDYFYPRPLSLCAGGDTKRDYDTG